MAGWSSLTNGSTLDCVGIMKKCQINHVTKGSVEEFGDHKDRLRCLFDLVLSGYLKRVTDKGFIRPVPAMLGNDGQSPDLLKLFLVVREIGGYEFVSKKGLWFFVVKELGLDIEVSAPVKLIYAKYLHELEQWLKKSHGDRNREGLDSGNFGFLSLKQEQEFRGLFTDDVDLKVVANQVALSEYIKHDKFILKDNESVLNVLDANNGCGLHNGVGDYDEKVCRNDLMALDRAVNRKEFNTRKRKRESLSGMLNWVIRVAKCHDDPSGGTILEPPKWKEHGGNEFWIQAIRAREALRLKRVDHSVTVHPLLQNNQKMHPSMFEDAFLSHQFMERLRCVSASALENDLTVVDAHLSSSDMCKTADPYVDDSFRRPVFVGPRFQAEVPEWSGTVSDSDSKWLGTLEWPLEGGKHNSLAVTDPIGRGRPDSCGCRFPGSVECIGFHIAEKRMKLKLELGSVFYHWKFDGMGEEVSLRWTAEEERKFKYMVQAEAPSYNAFWPNASKFFPSKTRQDLVSYYFNVFLIRCRSYQNRVTPESIDSDDDESEFGCSNVSLRSETLEVLPICVQNNQCFDWE